MILLDYECLEQGKRQVDNNIVGSQDKDENESDRDFSKEIGRFVGDDSSRGG